MESRPCRFIIDTPRRGTLNLALDLAMLQAVARGTAPPTIRLYRWEHPTVTIGYFQILQEAVHGEDCRRDRVPVIRRITGGGAALHDRARLGGEARAREQGEDGNEADHARA